MWSVAVESGRMSVLDEVTPSRMYVWLSRMWSSSRAVRLKVSAGSNALAVLWASLESLRTGRGDCTGRTLLVEARLGRGAARLGLGSSGRRLGSARLCLRSFGLRLGTYRL